MEKLVAPTLQWKKLKRRDELFPNGSLSPSQCKLGKEHSTWRAW